MEFVGFPELDGNVQLVVRTTNSSNVLANPDSGSTISYRIYSPSGTLMSNGTGTLSQMDTGTITGAADNGSGLIRITDAGHGLQTGDRVTIVNVGGTTEANSTWTVTVISSSTFDLQGSTFTNAYTSGGTWNVTGLYRASHAVTAANSFARGSTYIAIVTYTVTSVFSREMAFTVV